MVELTPEDALNSRASVAEGPASVGMASDPANGLFEGVWWLAHVKPRNEKALAADLERIGVTRFLPLARVRRRYQSRTTWVELPLFPGYLFFSGGEEERAATLRTRRTVQVISVRDQKRLKADLRQVRKVTSSGAVLDLYPRIERGRRCRVIRGCLKGVEGVVLRRRGACRVYIGVKTLGQSAELEIDPSLLELIE